MGDKESKPVASPPPPPRPEARLHVKVPIGKKQTQAAKKKRKARSKRLGRPPKKRPRVDPELDIEVNVLRDAFDTKGVVRQALELSQKLQEEFEAALEDSGSDDDCDDGQEKETSA